MLKAVYPVLISEIAKRGIKKRLLLQESVFPNGPCITDCPGFLHLAGKRSVLLQIAFSLIWGSRKTNCFTERTTRKKAKTKRGTKLITFSEKVAIRKYKVVSNF